MDSDVDLFVVRPRHVDAEDPGWRSQIDELSRLVERWTGNHAGISDIGEAELERLAAERPPVVDDLVRDGVTLVGEPAARLLGERP